MTSYFSIIFLGLFLPILILIYQLSSSKIRPYILLIASLVFYFLISGKLLVYVLFTTVLIYLVGLVLAKKNNIKNILYPLAIIIIVGIIIILKYSGFISLNLNHLFKLFNLDLSLTVPKFLLPIGLSFYSLQAISYLVDVKRKVVVAEDDIFKLMLYLLYFPTIIEGPIVRYADIKDEYFKGHKITYLNFKNGMLRIGYGLLKKLVIADRLNLFIKNVFNDYSSLSGSIILVAAIFYTIQLYAEFSGTMDLVIGVSEIFNIKIKENFRRPFFSKSIQEFWQRWHISLGTWFKDYIFYPINLAKPIKKLRKKTKGLLGNKYSIIVTTGISLLVVWLLNGLWHGSGFNYLFFGLYHFSLIYLASLIEPLSRNFKFKTSKYYDYFRIFRTGILVVIGELFFRAETLTKGLEMFKMILTDFRLSSLTKVTTLGIDKADLVIVFTTLLIIFIISLISEKGYSVRSFILSKKTPLRWAFYYSLIFYIIIFGAYGYGYIPVDPIYANF